nr:hypothetical protein Iba_chr03eCG10240 [Ipomoea batatas]
MGLGDTSYSSNDLRNSTGGALGGLRLTAAGVSNVSVLIVEEVSRDFISVWQMVENRRLFEFLLDLLFITKKATIAPITKMDITIPATAPPPIPDFPPPSLSLPSPFDAPLPDWRFLLGLFAGGVPGGGGGAGPEFHLLRNPAGKMVVLNIPGINSKCH